MRPPCGVRSSATHVGSLYATPTPSSSPQNWASRSGSEQSNTIVDNTGRPVAGVGSAATPHLACFRTLARTLGLTPKQTVWTIYLLTAACGLGALLLHQVNELGAVVILVMVGCMLATIAILEATARRDR